MSEEYEFPDPLENIDDVAQYVLAIGGMTYMLRLEHARKPFQNGRYFRWYSEPGSPLPIQQAEQISHLLSLAHCLDFDAIENETKQILWHGVRLYYGLSPDEFPLPAVLKPKPQPVTDTSQTWPRTHSADPLHHPGKHQHRQPRVHLFAIIVCALAVGFLLGRELPTSNPPVPHPVRVEVENSHHAAAMMVPVPQHKSQPPFKLEQKTTGLPIGVKSP